MKRLIIQKCTLEHLDQYGTIYAQAFSGEPRNDDWSVKDATIRVKELLENKQHYGLECTVDGEVIGFILGTFMLSHYGRTFKINDIAITPQHQHKRIASHLMEYCLADIASQGIKTVYLVTAREDSLTEFYEKYGFTEETKVVLLKRDVTPTVEQPLCRHFEKPNHRNQKQVKP